MSPRVEPSGWVSATRRDRLSLPCRMAWSRWSGAMLAHEDGARQEVSERSRQLDAFRLLRLIAPRTVAVVSAAITRKAPSSVRARSTLSS